MNNKNFFYKLENIVEKNKSFICVGLDSDLEKITEKFKAKKYPQYSFNKYIINKTFDLVCSYKLNTSFYEAIGHQGIYELKLTCDYLREKYPEIPIIIDAKRADIGNTNRGYVDFVFKYLQADAVTVNPYLGSEALKPFLEMKDKGIIILCKTSNEGSGEIQNLKLKVKSQKLKIPPKTAGKQKFKKLNLYQYLAYQVVNKWNKNKNCLLVIGATYPRQLKEIRSIVGDDIWFLVPGIGSQGGDINQVLKKGLNKNGKGLIINISRSVIFAEDPREKLKDFTQNIS
ncbi:MAG: orotidine 5'-phosphate decarboxylase [Patescibacteria group bacterium]|nr:MAG: orotidine 5'-phosphate decarboxylase [Patescibacteria group bacterium]